MTRSMAIMAIASLAACGSEPSPPAGDQPFVVRAGSADAVPGAPENFTGSVSIRALVAPEAPGRTAVGAVAFQPGSRSFWHTHPAGQALFVTDGCGWTQREGGAVERICQGDTAYVAAGVRHWHGATADTAMTHLAITETHEGRNVNWLEPVTDAQYRAGANTAR